MNTSISAVILDLSSLRELRNIHVTNPAKNPNARPVAHRCAGVLPRCTMNCNKNAVTPMAIIAANRIDGLNSTFSEATVETFTSLLGSNLLKKI